MHSRSPEPSSNLRALFSSLVALQASAGNTLDFRRHAANLITLSAGSGVLNSYGALEEDEMGLMRECSSILASMLRLPVSSIPQKSEVVVLEPLVAGGVHSGSVLATCATDLLGCCNTVVSQKAYTQLVKGSGSNDRWGLSLKKALRRVGSLRKKLLGDWEGDSILDIPEQVANYLSSVAVTFSLVDKLVLGKNDVNPEGGAASEISCPEALSASEKSSASPLLFGCAELVVPLVPGMKSAAIRALERCELFLCQRSNAINSSLKVRRAGSAVRGNVEAEVTGTGSTSSHASLCGDELQLQVSCGLQALRILSSLLSWCDRVDCTSATHCASSSPTPANSRPSHMGPAPSCMGHSTSLGDLAFGQGEIFERVCKFFDRVSALHGGLENLPLEVEAAKFVLRHSAHAPFDSEVVLHKFFCAANMAQLVECLLTQGEESPFGRQRRGGVASSRSGVASSVMPSLSGTDSDRPNNSSTAAGPSLAVALLSFGSLLDECSRAAMDSHSSLELLLPVFSLQSGVPAHIVFLFAYYSRTLAPFARAYMQAFVLVSRRLSEKTRPVSNSGAYPEQSMECENMLELVLDLPSIVAISEFGFNVSNILCNYSTSAELDLVGLWNSKRAEHEAQSIQGDDPFPSMEGSLAFVPVASHEVLGRTGSRGEPARSTSSTNTQSKYQRKVSFLCIAEREVETVSPRVLASFQTSLGLVDTIFDGADQCPTKHHVLRDLNEGPREASQDSCTVSHNISVQSQGSAWLTASLLVKLMKKYVSCFPVDALKQRVRFALTKYVSRSISPIRKHNLLFTVVGPTLHCLERDASLAGVLAYFLGEIFTGESALPQPSTLAEGCNDGSNRSPSKMLGQLSTTMGQQSLVSTYQSAATVLGVLSYLLLGTRFSDIASDKSLAVGILDGFRIGKVISVAIPESRASDSKANHNSEQLVEPSALSPQDRCAFFSAIAKICARHPPFVQFGQTVLSRCLEEEVEPIPRRRIGQCLDALRQPSAREELFCSA